MTVAQNKLKIKENYFIYPRLKEVSVDKPRLKKTKTFFLTFFS